MTIFYGLSDTDDLVKLIRSVSQRWPTASGWESINSLLFETLAVSTHCGTLPTNPRRLGNGGVAGISRLQFNTVQANTCRKHRLTLLTHYGVSLDHLDYHQLDYSPLLSLCIARLSYLLADSTIPTTLEGRAHYWARHYEPITPKPTPAEYIDHAEHIEHYLAPT